MKMREIIQIVEGAAISADKAKIVNHMVESLLSGNYWDTHATNMYPHREFSSMGDLYDMVGYWKDELPPEMQELPEKEIVETPEFAKLLTQWSNARYEEVVAKLSEIPRRRGQYRIHRIMRVENPAEFTNGGRLGIYWTYDLDEWEGHAIWGQDNAGDDICFEAAVPPAAIDWEMTILANMDWYSGDREFELRLNDGVPVKVKNIVMWDADTAQGYEALPVSPSARFTA